MNIKKSLMVAVVSLMIAFSLESCVTPATAQVEVGGYPSTEIIITNGYPYIIDNTVIYWYYGNRYWYPYYVNGHRHLRPYAVPHRHHPYAHRHFPHHRPGYAPHHRPPGRPGHFRPAHRNQHISYHRGNPVHNRGHFGGRR